MSDGLQEVDVVAGGAKGGWQKYLFAVALFAAVFWAYRPAWEGQVLWDDDAHITRPGLQSWNGLCHIWFDASAAQQYYPLLHSFFWVEHRLWGDEMLGYHWMNLLLHTTAALLVAGILRRLAIPGAYLAAAIFALHPIQVESVAWISEQKNTLSAVFYLSAMAVYLRYDTSRKGWQYGIALTLFVMGLLSKTVTATLPAALLVVFWWQRGRLSWRRDVVPLLPFFGLGLLTGLFTVWVERHLIGAEGSEFTLTLVGRFLLAGRVVWFYAGKLFWPTDLMFIYPRWHIDPAVWWQYLFPATALLVLAALWCVRRRWRGPLAGALFFGGTLFPALGFINVYPFIYSYVADHFQYLASVGLIVLVAAGVSIALQRSPQWLRCGGYGVCLAVLAVLAALTWQQSRMYADAQTLYETTIAQNPNCWLAYHNLGTIQMEADDLDEAIANFRRTVELNPECANAYISLGMAFERQGKLDDAIAEFEKGFTVRPDYPKAHYNLGVILQKHNRLKDAMTQYEEVLKFDPNSIRTHLNLGSLLGMQGRVDEAAAQFQKVLSISPSNAVASENLQKLRAEQERLEQVLTKQREMIRSQPNNIALLNATAWALATCPFAAVRNGAEAVALAQQALSVPNGQHPAVLGTLAAAYAEAGQFPLAVATAKKALVLAKEMKLADLQKSLQAKLLLYEEGKPYHQVPEESSAAAPEK